MQSSMIRLPQTVCRGIHNFYHAEDGSLWIRPTMQSSFRKADMVDLKLYVIHRAFAILTQRDRAGLELGQSVHARIYRANFPLN